MKESIIEHNAQLCIGRKIVGFKANEQRFIETFAARLRQGLRYNQRNGKAMTQHALAEATGLHYSIISRYARARRMPSAYHTALIARALNVSAEWLLGIRDEGRDKPWKTDSL